MKSFISLLGKTERKLTIKKSKFRLVKNSRSAKYSLLLIFYFLIACTSKDKLKEFAVYEYAVFKNAPIFEDEYIFPKKQKNCLKVKDDKLEWYLVDWNNNGRYDELGIDYLGLKLKTEYKPLLTILKERNYIKVDDQNYVIANISNYRSARKASTEEEVDLISMTKFVPIELINKERLIPELKTDFTIIYFWATWSKSSQETLLNLDFNKLKNASIDFIPIAYNCSNVNRFIRENSLNFPPLECSAQGVKAYHLNGTLKQFIFDQNGNLLKADRINLEDFF